MPTEKPTSTPDNSLVKKVEAARVKARELLRLRRLNDLMAQLNPAEKNLSKCQDCVKRKTAKAAGAEYDMEHLDEKHPEFEYKKADLLVKMEDNKLAVKDCQECADECQKIVDNLKVKVEEVSSGKWLCSLDELNSLADELLVNVNNA